MIDPRISMGVTVPNVSSAINIYDSILSSNLNREIAANQDARAQALAPFQQQQAEQNLALGDQRSQINDQVIAQNNQTFNTERQNQYLKSINDYAVGNASLIQNALKTNDPTQLKQSLIRRRESLIQQGLPTETTDQGIQMLEVGNIQGVASALNDAVNVYQQTQNQGMTATQRERTEALRVAQDPDATELERNSARRFLGDMANVSGGVAKTVDVGGVPHVFDPGKQTLVPAEISGQNVTANTVAESEAIIEGAKKEAAEEAATKGAGRRGAIASAKSFVDKASNDLREIPRLTTTYKDAIEQLDKGAETGIIYGMLPSIDTNALILDNIASEAGFSLAKSGGGIITEADMDWGMRTAIPRKLPPQELKTFLLNKVAAQDKIAKNLEEAIMFLGDGTKTLPDWYKFKKGQAKISEMTDEQLLGGF